MRKEVSTSMICSTSPDMKYISARWSKGLKLDHLQKAWRQSSGIRLTQVGMGCSAIPGVTKTTLIYCNFKNNAFT